MKVHALATAEPADSAPASPGRGFQGPWLPVKMEPFKAPGIAISGKSIPSHRVTGLNEQQDRNIEQQDAVFLGGILSLYNKTRDGSIVLSRARIKGMNINTWA